MGLSPPAVVGLPESALTATPAADPPMTDEDEACSASPSDPTAHGSRWDRPEGGEGGAAGSERAETE
eukprot:scaffold213058_cov26-Tisochrysis_lutea.AAC.1